MASYRFLVILLCLNLAHASMLKGTPTKGYHKADIVNENAEKAAHAAAEEKRIQDDLSEGSDQMVKEIEGGVMGPKPIVFTSHLSDQESDDSSKAKPKKLYADWVVKSSNHISKDKKGGTGGGSEGSRNGGSGNNNGNNNNGNNNNGNGNNNNGGDNDGGGNTGENGGGLYKKDFPLRAPHETGGGGSDGGRGNNNNGNNNNGNNNNGNNNNGGNTGGENGGENGGGLYERALNHRALHETGGGGSHGGRGNNNNSNNNNGNNNNGGGSGGDDPLKIANTAEDRLATNGGHDVHPVEIVASLNKQEANANATLFNEHGNGTAPSEASREASNGTSTSLPEGGSIFSDNATALMEEEDARAVYSSAFIVANAPASTAGSDSVHAPVAPRNTTELFEGPIAVNASTANMSEEHGGEDPAKHLGHHMESASLIVVCLVVFTVVFEYGKETMYHLLSNRQFERAVMDRTFAELAILGFVSFVLFLVHDQKYFSRAIAYITDDDFEQVSHILHEIHLLLFIVLLVYILIVVVLTITLNIVLHVWAIALKGARGLEILKGDINLVQLPFYLPFALLFGNTAYMKWITQVKQHLEDYDVYQRKYELEYGVHMKVDDSHRVQFFMKWLKTNVQNVMLQMVEVGSHTWYFLGFLALIAFAALMGLDEHEEHEIPFMVIFFLGGYILVVGVFAVLIRSLIALAYFTSAEYHNVAGDDDKSGAQEADLNTWSWMHPRMRTSRICRYETRFIADLLQVCLFFMAIYIGMWMMLFRGQLDGSDYGVLVGAMGAPVMFMVLVPFVLPSFVIMVSLMGGLHMHHSHEEHAGHSHGGHKGASHESAEGEKQPET